MTNKHVLHASHRQILVGVDIDTRANVDFEAQLRRREQILAVFISMKMHMLAGGVCVCVSGHNNVLFDIATFKTCPCHRSCERRLQAARVSLR